MKRPFHLAFSVTDLNAAHRFYVETLGCRVGRRDDRWIDFDLYGHQITAHLVESPNADDVGKPSSGVDGDHVPVPHFGCVLPWDEWHSLVDRLERADTKPFIGPRIRFQGQPGEQATLFVHDPSGNALEFKSFREPSRLFSDGS